MSTRKATMLAGLALALVALSPASATAAAGGTDRPMKGTASGTVSVNVQTLAISADLAGVSTHLGKYTAHVEANGTLTPQGTIATGPITLVASNGDQLTGIFTLNGPAPTPNVHTAEVVVTFTGGTGRFADASGTVRSTPELTPFAFDGVTLLERSEGPVRGRISY